MSRENTAESAPWYRHAMVWFIIVLPLSVVVASLVTINIAFQNKPQIVAAPTNTGDNYDSATNSQH